MTSQGVSPMNTTLPPMYWSDENPVPKMYNRVPPATPPWVGDTELI